MKARSKKKSASKRVTVPRINLRPNAVQYQRFAELAKASGKPVAKWALEKLDQATEVSGNVK